MVGFGRYGPGGDYYLFQSGQEERSIRRVRTCGLEPTAVRLRPYPPTLTG